METVSPSLVMKLLPGLALVALALPASASAQATRTWVSGLGDDANPCSIPAPCKTFAGAISKTATDGEINCLDPGGFGAVTIVKGITIDCRGVGTAGVLVSGTNGIVVNANTAGSNKIVLKGLDIEGLGSGLNGINVVAAKNVKVVDTSIHNFSGNAINFAPSAPSGFSHGLVKDADIGGNAGSAVLVEPGGATGAVVSVRNSTIDDNACGLVVGTFCNGAPGSGTANTSVINAFHNEISNNTTGVGCAVFTQGSNALVRLGDNEINGNIIGLSPHNPGAAGGITSFGDNYIDGNDTNGAPTRTISTSKR